MIYLLVIPRTIILQRWNENRYRAGSTESYRVFGLGLRTAKDTQCLRMILEGLDKAECLIKDCLLLPC